MKYCGRQIFGTDIMQRFQIAFQTKFNVIAFRIFRGCSERQATNLNTLAIVRMHLLLQLKHLSVNVSENMCSCFAHNLCIMMQH